MTEGGPDRQSSDVVSANGSNIIDPELRYRQPQCEEEDKTGGEDKQAVPRRRVSVPIRMNTHDSPDPHRGETGGAVSSEVHEDAASSPEPSLIRHSPLRPHKESLSRRIFGKNSQRNSKWIIRMIWLDVLSILVLFGISGAVHRWAPIFMQGDRWFPVSIEQGVPTGVRELSYPMYHPTPQSIAVPSFMGTPRFIVPITEFSVLLPILCGVAIALMQFWIRSASDKMAALLGLYKSFVIVTLIHTTLKKFIGKFRPNFMDVCRPSHDLSTVAIFGQRWARVRECTSWITVGKTSRPTADLIQAMSAFPSGHTSEAFAAATYLALYLNAKLKPFSDYHTSMWKIVLVIAPLFAECFVAGSLTIDHNHAPQDVLLSIPIGVAVAMLCFRAHYASLFNYRTNHLYLPWTGMHRCLHLERQRPLESLTSKYRNSRFRHYDNLTAVAWPRRPAAHNFRGPHEAEKPRGQEGRGRVDMFMDGACDLDGDLGHRDARLREPWSSKPVRLGIPSPVNLAARHTSIGSWAARGLPAATLGHFAAQPMAHRLLKKAILNAGSVLRRKHETQSPDLEAASITADGPIGISPPIDGNVLSEGRSPPNMSRRLTGASHSARSSLDIVVPCSSGRWIDRVMARWDDDDSLAGEGEAL